MLTQDSLFNSDRLLSGESSSRLLDPQARRLDDSATRLKKYSINSENKFLQQKQYLYHQTTL